MFTGIVEERGRVTRLDERDGATRMAVRGPKVSGDAELGASVAVNGVCLTVVERDEEQLAFDLAPETVSRSTLAGLRAGDPVNLERPVTLSTRLGGHLVQGHVDGVGAVRSVDRDGGGALMEIEVPPALRRYLVEKGSVAVDGVSLTVASVRDGRFSVALLPHTLTVTTLGDRRAGDRVNLEVDVVAKYIEGLMGRRT